MMKNFVERLMEQAKNAKETVAKIEMTGESAAGMVKVVMDGQYQVRQILIEDDIYREDKTIVVELITAAVNQASANVKQAIKEKMTELMGGVGFPSHLSSLF